VNGAPGGDDFGDPQAPDTVPEAVGRCRIGSSRRFLGKRGKTDGRVPGNRNAAIRHG